MQKRLKEARKIEKAQIKAARNAARAAAKLERSEIEVPEGVDPDLIGLVAGPQPVKEDPLAVYDADAAVQAAIRGAQPSTPDT